MTGADALREAARLETARVYGLVVRDHATKRRATSKHKTLDLVLRELVEQAIARGETNTQIMHRHGITYPHLMAIKQGMSDE